MIKSKVRKRKDILPTNVTGYQSSSSSRRNASNSTLDSKTISIIEFILIIILIITTIYYRYSYTQTKDTLHSLYQQFTEDQQKIAAQQNELDHLREKLRTSQNAGHNDHPIEPVQSSHNKDKDEWNETDKQWIKDIQANDYKSLRLEYGEGPIQILIETNLG